MSFDSIPINGALFCGESTRTQDGDTCKLLDGGDLGGDSLGLYSRHLLHPPHPPYLPSPSHPPPFLRPSPRPAAILVRDR